MRKGDKAVVERTKQGKQIENTMKTFANTYTHRDCCRNESDEKGEEKVKIAGDDNKRAVPETDERVTEK